MPRDTNEEAQVTNPALNVYSTPDNSDNQGGKLQTIASKDAGNKSLSVGCTELHTATA
jgi:hypothetical protein